MKKKVSLKDIASKAGVSTALVSYVLNDQKSGRIRKEVAMKIKEIAQELNYRPNQIAKSLKTNKTYTIGLIVADISNSFFSNLARIIEDEADKFKYTVIFGSADENAGKSFRLINALLDRQVDGFIIAPAEHAESNINYLREHDIPFVLIDRYFPGVETNWVSLDNYKASYAATRHLLDGGNIKPGLITYNTDLYNLQERKRGYEDALKDNNIKLNKSWSKEIFFGEDIKLLVEKAISDLLSLPKPIDSLLFTSNTLALYGLKFINEKKIKIPDELALVTFDELDASDLFYAPLTYLKQPMQEMGQIATRILLENIDKEKKIRQVNLDATLVIRQSTLAILPK